MRYRGEMTVWVIPWLVPKRFHSWVPFPGLCITKDWVGATSLHRDHELGHVLQLRRSWLGQVKDVWDERKVPHKQRSYEREAAAYAVARRDGQWHPLRAYEARYV